MPRASTPSAEGEARGSSVDVISEGYPPARAPTGSASSVRERWMWSIPEPPRRIFSLAQRLDRIYRHAPHSGFNMPVEPKGVRDRSVTDTDRTDPKRSLTEETIQVSVPAVVTA